MEVPAAAAHFATSGNISELYTFGHVLGKAVQVDPVAPTLKAPGSKRSTL
jgi:hypothetical protein